MRIVLLTRETVAWHVHKMIENLYRIDKENLIRMRKEQKMTQADVAGKLGMSLRKYVDYEISSEDVFLSSLDFGKLAYALNVNSFMLLGELPTFITCHWKRSGSVSKFAEQILSGRCELKVEGLPSDKKLRAPLVEIVEIYEKCKREIQDDTILSESLKQRFRCEDLLEQLISDKADDEKMPGDAELFGMRVPGLSVTLDWFYARDDDDPEQVETLTWNMGTVLLIDFNKSSEDQPVTYQLIDDPQWALTLDMNKDEAPEAYEKMVNEALGARPKIPLSDDDEHIFQTEPYKNPEPKVDEVMPNSKADNDK